MRPADIVCLVAADHGLTSADLYGRSRTRRVVAARQAAMLAVRRQTDMSLSEIGRLFDRDHTTVLHGIRRAEQALACEECGQPSWEGTRWCAIGGCVEARGRWSWSRSVA